MAEDVSSLRAVAHPVRLRMLSLLTGTAMSAAEIARELDLTHANASYHLRVLAEAGEVVEAGEERIRGGVAKRYRHPWDQVRPAPGTGPGARGDEARETYVRVLAGELVRRFGLRSRRARAHLTDAEVWVPPEVWERAVALVDEAARLVHAEARPPRSAGTLHVNLSAALFTMTRER
jgi:predicted transcriptional regulator